ncbi:MAG: S24/S26 family peptidase [Desulforegulaceae bacterium]|nr:S24/S26 family peptidase [Desulforegulaceae bacterium]
MNRNKSSVLLSGENFAEIMESVLKKNADFKFTAKGYSMSPFIKDLDILIISPLKKNPGFGDVAAVKNKVNGFIIVHRIIFKYKNKFLLKGDNLKSCDGFYYREEILGIVSSVFRNNKKIWFGKKIIGFLSLVKILNFVILPCLRFVKQNFLYLKKVLKK